MNINEIFLLVNYIAGKNQQGNITPDNFNLLVKASNAEYQSFLIGQVEQFQYNNPKSRVGLGNSELVLSALSPFIPSPVALTVNATTGIAPYPNDYIQRIAVYDSSMNKIRWVMQEKLPAYLGSTIDPIGTNPIYLLQKDGLQFYPFSIVSPKLSYIQTGATPYWGYVASGSITALSGFSLGIGYIDGTYYNVPLRGGGGVGAEATIVVSGGEVTSVVLTKRGGNFIVGDIMTALNSYIGGAGSGFSFSVGNISSYQRAVYDPTSSQDLLWGETDQIEVVARILKKVGVNLMAGQITQYATEVKNIGV